MTVMQTLVGKLVQGSSIPTVPKNLHQTTEAPLLLERQMHETTEAIDLGILLRVIEKEIVHPPDLHLTKSQNARTTKTTHPAKYTPFEIY
jgi:hypothetical protein